MNTFVRFVDEGNSLQRFREAEGHAPARESWVPPVWSGVLVGCGRTARSREQESRVKLDNAGSDPWAPGENWLCRSPVSWPKTARQGRRLRPQ